MEKSKNLGEFEILVLGALLRLKDEAYGAKVRQEIEARASRQVSVGALYSTLSRLEDKGYVVSSIGASSAVRGGRAKRIYDLTDLGRQKLETAISGLNAMLEGISVWQNHPIR